MKNMILYVSDEAATAIETLLSDTEDRDGITAQELDSQEHQGSIRHPEIQEHAIWHGIILYAGHLDTFGCARHTKRRGTGVRAVYEGTGANGTGDPVIQKTLETVHNGNGNPQEDIV